MINEKIYSFVRFLAVVLIAVLLFIFALQSVVFIHYFWPDTVQIPGMVTREKVGVLSVRGPLFESEPLLEDLEQFARRDDVKAVLLDVDSPGGAVAPIQEINEGLEQVKKAGKPVVASIRSVGASGGYYLASGADTVVATPGSMVGSIGVQLQLIRFDELIEKVGIEYEVIKSGEYKDIGSPFREMEEDERIVLRNMIMDVYDQFIEHIIDHRETLGRSEVEQLADGSVFTGRQADDIGLVDKVGTKKKALDLAGKAGNIGKSPETARPRRKSHPFRGGDVSRLLGSVGEVFSQNETRVRLLYMISEWG